MRSVVSIVAATTIGASVHAAAPTDVSGQAAHDHDAPMGLVQLVRDATAAFADVNVAAADGNARVACDAK